jgi:phospholipid-translocating ATPase
MPDIFTRHIYCIKQLFVCKINSIIFERLSKNGRTFEVDTTRHLNEYGEAGLRTLALSYRVLEESEYSAWNAEFIKAKTSIGADREAQLERVAELMEKDLILVGATAVEDKLQRGVSNASMVSINIVIFAMLAKPQYSRAA